MKVIFHIGMGKTGTSSIQRALSLSGAKLAQSRAEYLGMWFGMIEPEYDRFDGANRFLKLDADAMRDAAQKFADFVQKRHVGKGLETFIVSNEAMFQHATTLRPFLEELKRHHDIQLVAYVRDPRSWLPSAHVQWSIRHKTYAGPIQGFAERAPVLMKQYAGFREWVSSFEENLSVRNYDATDDVVADFSSALGLDLEVIESRVLERGDDAEIVLRALYNDRYPNPVLPDLFDQDVMKPNRGIVRGISEIADLCFRTDGLESVLEGERDLLFYLNEKFQIDYLGERHGEERDNDCNEAREKLFDLMVEIILRQGQRLSEIENELEKLKNSH